MALIDDTATRRVDVYDGWIDIKANLSIGHVLGMAEGSGGLTALTNPTPEMIRKMLGVAIAAWSYDDPVTPANIDRLDMQAASSVVGVLNELVAGSEKKDEANSLSLNGADGTPISSTSS